jgi:hypothetical protein
MFEFLMCSFSYYYWHCRSPSNLTEWKKAKAWNLSGVSLPQQCDVRVKIRVPAGACRQKMWSATGGRKWQGSKDTTPN